MLKKLTASLLLLAASLLPALAQSVKGTVCDSLAATPLPYATVRLFATDQKAERPLKAAVTDEEGRFRLTAPKAGDYRLRIQAVGTAVQERIVSLVAGDTCDVGTVLLVADDAGSLQEATVSAARLLVKNEIDRLSYDLAEDPDAQTSSMLEMLRKVPMVTVDGDDNIKINGNASFKVYVNGKPNTMMSNNPSLVLKNYPATAVKKVEVVTNPGAKYDAEGVAGILNIVTQTEVQTKGYSLTPNLRFGTTGAMGGLYALAQFGKLTFSVQYGAGYTRQGRQYNRSERFNLLDDVNYHRISENWGRPKGFMQYGNAEASYEVNAHHLFSFSGGLWGYRGRMPFEASLGMYPLSGADAVYRCGIDNRMSLRYLNFNASLDYQWTMQRPEQALTVSYRLNGGPSDTHSRNIYRDLEGDIPATLTDERSEPNQRSLEHTIQTDFTTPLGEEGKGGKLSAGAKYIYRLNRSDNDAFTRPSGTDQPWERDEQRSLDFRHNGHIAALYAEYVCKLGDFSLQAGTRYELYRIHATYPSRPEADFNASLSDVVPSVTLGWNLGATTMLKLGYNLRIGRPGIDELSPYCDWSAPDAYKVGNPSLKSQRANNVNFAVSSFSKTFSLNAEFTYSWMNNGFVDFSRIDQTTYATPVFISTSKSGLHSKTAGLNLFLNWQLTKTTSFNLNGNVWYNDYRAATAPSVRQQGDGWTVMCFGGLRQKLPWKLKLNLWAGGSNGDVTLQGKSNGFHFYSLGLSRTFLKEDRLTLTLNAANFIKPWKSYRDHSSSTDFIQSSLTKHYQAGISLSVQWRIGSLTTQVKKTARSIENNDVEQRTSGAESGAMGQ